MQSHFRLKLLVAALGLATGSLAMATETRTLQAQDLNAVRHRRSPSNSTWVRIAAWSRAAAWRCPTVGP